MAHCPSCFIRLPLSGEANCDCEPRAVAGPVAQQAPVGTHGHPHPGHDPHSATQPHPMHRR